MRSTAPKLAAGVLVALAALGGAELGARLLWGAPTGYFNFSLSGPNGLYPPNATMRLSYGPVAYTVRTNALGMRGADLPALAAAGTTRIALVGDSLTDGFFVDNEATYPARLERDLTERGQRVEVISAAKGGGSINREFAIARDVVLPLRPALVVLTFVTNDIFELRGTARADLLAFPLQPRWRTRLLGWWLTHTAIGETLAKQSLGKRLGHAIPTPRDGSDDARYRIDGGDDYRANAALFDEKFGASDGLVLRDPWSEQTQTLVDSYVFVLKALAALCREHGTRLAFVYTPAYTQVYGSASLRIRDTLRDACAALDVPFLDLTPVLRAEGDHRVLHLAPLDFHPNPDGNRVIAGAVASFLLDAHLVASPARPD